MMHKTKTETVIPAILYNTEKENRSEYWREMHSIDNFNSLFLTGIKLEADPQFRYLGDFFNNKKLQGA